jgi:hypothetical protein
MDLDDQLMQEQLLSSPMAVDDSRWLLVGRINNDFDVNEFKQDEEEQKEEERIGDVVSSDLEDSNDEQGGRHAMPPSFLSLHMCTMQLSLWQHLGHSLAIISLERSIMGEINLPLNCRILKCFIPFIWTNRNHPQDGTTLPPTPTSPRG